jgi:hypothetical protein
MKQTTGYGIALLILGSGFYGPVLAQKTASPSDIEPDAMAALNKMGAYLRTLKAYQVEAAITDEDVMEDGQKWQFGHKTNVLAVMPDKLRVDVDGEQKSRLFFYDGKTFTLFARRAGFYASVSAPGTIAELIDVASDKYDIDVPLVDLFLWGGPKATTNQVTAASDVGPGVVEGVTCEHYAYRQPGLDWQIWIQLGDFPLPRKLVLTTTTDEARPQHESVLTWNLAPSYDAEAFVFDPPADAHKIVFAGKEKK